MQTSGMGIDKKSGNQPFFWLHIKKCGGQSLRKAISPPYKQTDRKKTQCFSELPKEEWNDAINNYRLRLGYFDFKRMLFAKRYLYPEEEFFNMFKFTVVRNPYDRVVSSWKYLLQKPGSPKVFLKPRRARMKYSFEYFLHELPHLWETKYDRHMATHTAPIWDDITDHDDQLLVDEIIKLERINEGMSLLNYKIGLKVNKLDHINRTSNRKSYRKYYTKKTKKKVEDLFEKDIVHLKYDF